MGLAPAQYAKATRQTTTTTNILCVAYARWAGASPAPTFSIQNKIFSFYLQNAP